MWNLQREQNHLQMPVAAPEGEARRLPHWTALPGLHAFERGNRHRPRVPDRPRLDLVQDVERGLRHGLRVDDGAGCVEQREATTRPWIHAKKLHVSVGRIMVLRFRFVNERGESGDLGTGLGERQFTATAFSLPLGIGGEPLFDDDL